MPHKKIIFVIVEGPSDESALGVLLNRIYCNASVHVHIMHCDITTERNVNPSNIVAKVGGLVRKYAGRIFKPVNFSKIIHIVDMDGAYIPNDSVIQDDTCTKAHYAPTAIHTPNKPKIEERNQQKRENLDKLSATTKIWNIPYQVYYMSCNLDHALYDKLNTPDSEKEEDAVSFAIQYKDNIPAFLKFISESDFAVTTDYLQSWQYIRSELHSLERHTNLSLCFSDITNPQP